MGQYINGFYVFAPVTSTDHAGLLWVAAILSLLFSVVTLFTRYHIKRRAFGTDDWLITAATVSLDLTCAPRSPFLTIVQPGSRVGAIYRLVRGHAELWFRQVLGSAHP